MSDKADSKAQNQWNAVTRLRIFAPDAQGQGVPLRIFPNTRQQCLVNVTFAATYNGNPVAFDMETAKRFVRLAEYGNTVAINHSDTFHLQLGWLSSYTSQNYTWDQAMVTRVAELNEDIGYVLSNPELIERHMNHRDESAHPYVDGETVAVNGHDWDRAFFRDVLEHAQKQPYANESISIDGPDAIEPHLTEASNVTADETYQTTVSFLVSTSSANQTRKFSAIFYYPDLSLMAHTGDPEVIDENGAGKDGRFNSSVTIASVNWLKLPRSCYGNLHPENSAVLNDANQVVNNSVLRTFESWIDITFNNRLLILRSGRESSTGNQNFSLYRNAGQIGKNEWTITYVGQPGKTDAKWSENLGYLHSESAGTTAYRISKLMELYAPITYNSPTRLIIGHILGKEHWQIYDTAYKGLEAVDLRHLVIRDEYGNDHQVTITLPVGGWNYIGLIV